MNVVKFTAEDEDAAIRFWEYVSDYASVCGDRPGFETLAVPPSPVVEIVIRVIEPRGGPAGGLRVTDIVRLADGRIAWFDDEEAFWSTSGGPVDPAVFQSRVVGVGTGVCPSCHGLVDPVTGLALS